MGEVLTSTVSPHSVSGSESDLCLLRRHMNTHSIMQKLTAMSNTARATTAPTLPSLDDEVDDVDDEHGVDSDVRGMGKG